MSPPSTSTPTSTSKSAANPTSNGAPSGSSLPRDVPTGEVEGEFTRVLSREEKRKLRKVEKHRPQFQFDLSHFRNGRKIGIAHVRDLVLYLLADGMKPTWIVPENRTFITHVVVLLVPGLLPEHIGIPPIPSLATLPFPIAPSMIERVDDEPLPPNKVPVLSQMFSYGVPSRAPGDSRRLFSVMTTLLNSPLPDNVKKRREEEGRRLSALAKADNAPPFLYLLSANQMIDNDYRVPSYVSPSDAAPIPEVVKRGLPAELLSLLACEETEAAETEGEIEGPPPSAALPNGDGKGTTKWKDEGWAETPQADQPPVDGQWKVLAVDCEMVLTENGPELARVSVIDYNTGTNVFDELVKPSAPVTDYLTQWSGITPEHISAATHTLESIQAAFLSSPTPVLTPHTILLGHSLECDLAALKIRHPLCIDTALIFRHPRGPPYKPGLKWLTNKWLGREIQGAASGHDSEEDATACVDLLKLKMANGPEFGNLFDNTEPIFDRMARLGSQQGKVNKTSAYCDYFNMRGGLSARATTAVKCTSDDEVVGGIATQVESHDFVFGRFMELANVQGWNGEAHVPASMSEAPSLGLDKALENLNRRLAEVHKSLPRNTAFIVLNGHSDPLPMLALSARRTRWERLVKTLGTTDGIKGEDRWLAEDDRKLEAAVNQAREGMAFFCVK
ncbi:hypothetical protein JCM24511_06854 [Saitozyma sp. JCM 24511]|nr:hypothetical protein JCM24511_06854 [Saitozyma sp. JCM 24511]